MTVKKKVPRGFDPPMSKETHHGYALSLRWLADQMGLRDWHVELNFEAETDDDVYATCSVPEHRRFAIIALFPGWEDLSDVDKLQTLVHELMHCHLAAMQDLLRTTIPKTTSDAHWETLDASINQMVETAVDNVAIAWSTKMSMTEFRRIVKRK